MSEGSRLVAFDEEVSGPGEAVSHHRPEQRVPWMSNHKRDNQRAQTQGSAGGMHGAVARIAMLMQVEGEELVVTGELLLGHLFCPCSGAVWWKQGKRSKRTSCPSND